MSQDQERVLRLLAGRESMSVKEIEGILHDADHEQLENTIGDLQKRELVQQKPDEDQAGEVVVAITERGLERMSLRLSHRRMLAEVLDEHLDDQRLDDTLDVLPILAEYKSLPFLHFASILGSIGETRLSDVLDDLAEHGPVSKAFASIITAGVGESNSLIKWLQPRRSAESARQLMPRELCLASFICLAVV